MSFIPPFCNFEEDNINKFSTGNRVVGEITPGVPDPASSNFGRSVAIAKTSGDRIVVGADNNTEGGFAGTGAVYVYFFNGTAWVLEQKIIQSLGGGATFGPQLNDQYGQAVAMSADGSILAVGSPGWDLDPPINNSEEGAIYIYSRSGTTWSLVTRFNPSAAYAGMGASLDMNDAGTRIIAGAPFGSSTSQIQAGSAFIYNFSGSWSLQARIDAELGLGVPEAQQLSRYGSSVAMNAAGDKVIVGSDDRNESTGNGDGAAYIYSLSGSWSFDQKIRAESSPGVLDEGVLDRFGTSVSMNGVGDKVVVGKEKTGAYVYSLSGTWSLEKKLFAEVANGVGDISSGFGRSVAISSLGNRIMVGASVSGRVYGYKYDGSSWVYETWVRPENGDGNYVSASGFGGIVEGIAFTLDGSKYTIGANSSGSTFIYDILNP